MSKSIVKYAANTYLGPDTVYGSPFYGPQIQPVYSMQTHCGVGASDTAAKLDNVTRSRNALIIAVIVFVLAFAACFTAVFILAFPEPAAKQPDKVLITVEITRTTEFSASMNTVESTTKLAISLFCGDLKVAVTAASTSVVCVQKPGTNFTAGPTIASTKATMLLTLPMDGKTAVERYNLVKASIEAADSGDTQWSAPGATILLAGTSISAASAVNAIKFPVLLMLLYIIHKLF